MKTLSNNDIARAIYLSTNEKRGAHLATALHQVVKFLARRRLLGRREEILASFKKIINKENRIVNAKVSSVEKLKHKTKEDLEHLLKKRYSAKEVMLEEELDKSLLGGLRVEVNDEVIDLSVKNKIGQLQEYLMAKI